MTTPQHTRQSAVRVIASSLCFDAEPAYVKQLDKARQAGAAIVDALCDAGILGPQFDNRTVNGHDTAADAIVSADVDTVPAF